MHNFYIKILSVALTNVSKMWFTNMDGLMSNFFKNAKIWQNLNNFFLVSISVVFEQNDSSYLVPNFCPGKEYKWRRTFFSESQLLRFEMAGRKDSCLPSEARLDSSSDRRLRKGKVVSRKKMFVWSCNFLPRTKNWHPR